MCLGSILRVGGGGEVVADENGEYLLLLWRVRPWVVIVGVEGISQLGRDKYK